VIENKKVRKEKDKEIRKEKKEITPSRDKVVPDYNRDDTISVCDESGNEAVSMFFPHTPLHAIPTPDTNFAFIFHPKLYFSRCYFPSLPFPVLSRFVLFLLALAALRLCHGVFPYIV